MSILMNLMTRNQPKSLSGIKPLDVLFFDMDGTLIDTDKANFLAYQKALKVLCGIDLPLPVSERVNNTFLKKMFPTLSTMMMAEITKLKARFYEDYLPLTTLNPVFEKMLKKFSPNQKVLVTNSAPERAMMTLEFHGIAHQFSDRFYRGKSDEESKYQKAISAIQVAPADVLAFENEWPQMQAAMTAGIQHQNLYHVAM